MVVVRRPVALAVALRARMRTWLPIAAVQLKWVAMEREAAVVPRPKVVLAALTGPRPTFAVAPVVSCRAVPVFMVFSWAPAAAAAAIMVAAPGASFPPVTLVVAVAVLVLFQEPTPSWSRGTVRPRAIRRMSITSNLPVSVVLVA